MPADIGPNHHVMPPCIFAKLFPSHITTDGKPTGLHPCKTRLTAYNGSNTPQFRALDIAIKWIPKGHQHSECLQTIWYVAGSPGPTILGLTSSSKLGIVQLNCAVKLINRCDPASPPKKPTTEHTKVWHDLTSLLNSSEDLIKAYPNQFDSIGRFSWTYYITLSDEAKPVAHPPRKSPIAMWPLVHEDLDEFLGQGIIVPVEEPTNWVSSLVCSWKANGKLWVCLDPKDLNAAIRHDHYKTPAVEEITHELTGSTCFTKLDGTSSYLWIVLDYEPSLLMTFNTPWGRFRFVCLPLGLACAQNSFQWMMDQILTYCDGVIGIADNVVVHGKDDKEHDKHLHKFMRVTHEHGLVFNKDKCAVKQTSIVFLGCVHDTNGAHPDPEKACAVHKMPAPKTATQLQKYLGLVTYLSPFIPLLSSFTAQLYELLKKGSEFIWNNSYQEAFDKVKSMVCKDTMLWYFNVCRPVTVHVDASQKDLGPALLQNGYPVASLPNSYTYQAALCQHRTWTACLCLCSRMIPHLCLWPCLHYREWPQVLWTDQHHESGRYTCLSTENAATIPKLWCHHQVLTWQRAVSCRCSLLLCTPQSSRDIFRHHHQPCAHHIQQRNWVPDFHPR